MLFGLGCLMTCRESCFLSCNTYSFTVDTINMVPNTQTGKYTTPFQLITRKRPVIGAHKFGEVRVHEELNDVRAEFGIYCGYDVNPIDVAITRIACTSTRCSAI